MSLCSEWCHHYSQGEKYLDLGHTHWCAEQHMYHASSKLRFVISYPFTTTVTLHFFSDITNKNIVINVPLLVDFINLNTKSLN